MESESLNGTLVLVRPDLIIDPANGQGKVAIVNYDSLPSREIYVAFNNGKEAVYAPESLLRLTSKEDILRDLKANATSMPVNDFKDLYKISLLLDRGTSTGQWQALELAGTSPGIWDKALQPVKPIEKLALETAFTR